ncbi:MAG: MFS transporter [Pseudomonadota bacterium]
MAQSLNARVLAAGAIGNALEWYDFAIYAYFAPVIATHFFPSDDPVNSILATFGVLAAGYIMRPLGGILLGHVGDRAGRRFALSLSIILMAVPTSLIAVLPTFDAIGIAAPIVLTILRLLQGLSVGGEYMGSVVFVAERAPKRRRGLAASVCSTSGSVGILVASAVATLLGAVMAEDTLNDWGWRLPFAAGLLLGGIGFLLRRHIQEIGPALGGSYEPPRMPIFIVVRDHLPTVLRTFALAGFMGALFYVTFVYLTTYLTEVVGTGRSAVLEINTVAMIVLVIVMPLFGLLSDRIGRKPVIIGSAVGTLVLSYPLFLLLHSGNVGLEVVGDLGLAVLMGASLGPMPALMAELYPKEIRYSATAFSYNLPVAIFGGTAPLIATFLVAETGNDYSPAFYLIVMAVIGLAALMLTPETKDVDLHRIRTD